MEPATKEKGVVASTREQPPSSDMERQDSSGTLESQRTFQNDVEKDNTITMGPIHSTQEGEVEDKNLVDYMTMNWFHGGMLMIAECISLGILGLPNAMAQLGLFP